MTATVEQTAEQRYLNYMNPSGKIPLSLKLVRKTIQIGNTLAPRITARWLEKLFFTPKRVKLKPDQLEYYNSGISYKIQYNNKDVFVHEKGNSERKVLFVHGWGSSSYRFRFIADILVENGMQVVMFDQPGNSQSKGKQTTAVQVAEIIHLLHAKYNFEAIITHSFGGFASLVAINRGLNINTLITIAIPAKLSFFSDSFQNLLKIPPALFEQVIDLASHRLGGKFSEFEPLNLLDTPPQKFVLIHSKDDTIIPHTGSVEFSNKFDSTLFLFDGMGHRNILKDDKVINTILSILQ